MRIFKCLVVGVSLSCLLGCSTTPTLQEATGSAKPEVFIRDVVQRVRCEIYDAAVSLRKKKKLAWAKNWQAKVNLTLGITNNAGLTPAVQMIRPLPNAFFDGGSASGGSLLSTIGQKFTFGANATLSESSTRTELVVFTVAFGDIIAQEADFSGSCQPTGAELRDGLGLLEWIDSAFAPVEKGQLLAGKTPKPNTAKFLEVKNNICSLYNTLKAKLPDNINKSCNRAERISEIDQLRLYWKSASKLNDKCVDEAFIQRPELDSQRDKDGLPKPNSLLEEIQQHYDRIVNVECVNLNEIYMGYKARDKFTSMAKDLSANSNDAQRHYEDNIEPFIDVLLKKDDTERDIKKALNELNEINVFVEKITSSSPINDLIDQKAQMDGLEKCHPHRSDPTFGCSFKYGILILVNHLVAISDDLQDSSKKSAAYIKGFTPSRPIDSLSHTVTFVLTYGGGLQPSWQLLRFAGSTSQLASAQGARTHSLLIAIGPPEENKTNIQNQALANSRSP